MNYFKDTEHLTNFIRMIIRENSNIIDLSEVLQIEFYTSTLIRYGIADKFGFDLRHNPSLLQENNFWDWMRINSIKKYTISDSMAHILTKEFKDTIEMLLSSVGVYSFWNKDQIPLYTGMSINLGNRIQESFSYRFREYTEEVFLRYAATKTASDAALYEIVMIATYKPALNGVSKYKDNLTIPITPPELSDPILCNITKERDSTHPLEESKFTTKDEVQILAEYVEK